MKTTLNILKTWISVPCDWCNNKFLREELDDDRMCASCREYLAGRAIVPASAGGTSTPGYASRLSMPTDAEIQERHGDVVVTKLEEKMQNEKTQVSLHRIKARIMTYLDDGGIGWVPQSVLHILGRHSLGVKTSRVSDAIDSLVKVGKIYGTWKGKTRWWYHSASKEPSISLEDTMQLVGPMHNHMTSYKYKNSVATSTIKKRMTTAISAADALIAIAPTVLEEPQVAPKLPENSGSPVTPVAGKLIETLGAAGLSDSQVINMIKLISAVADLERQKQAIEEQFNQLLNGGK